MATLTDLCFKISFTQPICKEPPLENLPLKEFNGTELVCITAVMHWLIAIWFHLTYIQVCFFPLLF